MPRKVLHLPLAFAQITIYNPRMFNRPPFRLPLFSAFLLCALALTGCGIGPAATPTSVALPASNGHVMGGQQPISGATIQLYAVGSAGDGSAASPLLTS